jgi:hypothetical protein
MGPPRLSRPHHPPPAREPPIDVDDKSRELMESRTYRGTLNGWFRRALKADKASDLFAA